MALSTESKKEIVSNFGRTENDTGASEVQVALLTANINALQSHFKDNSNWHIKSHVRKGQLQLKMIKITKA